MADLVLSANEAGELSATEHVFDRVDIASGATLTIAGSSPRWCVIRCLGNFTLAGSIIYRGVRGADDELTATMSDGSTVAHRYRNDVFGGDGGMGGGESAAIGADGTASYGGGGGGGSTRGYRSFRVGAPGVGRRGGATNKRGGDGARLGAINGGLLALDVEGEFDGAGGSVDVSGMPGEAGGAGEDGWAGAPFYEAGGGGGGGGPGGEGGHFFVYAATIEEECGSRKEGGAGGGPGRGGNARHHTGDAGRAGETGDDGRVVFRLRATE